jgi:uncharacterized protein (TIGR03067 family)
MNSLAPPSKLEQQLRDMNQALLVSSVRQHELADEARRAEAALRESEMRLADEVNALARLNEASSRLWRMHDLRAGLEEMLDATIKLLGADMGNIQMFDADRGVLVIAAQRGFQQDFLDFFREVSTEDDTACGRALRSGARIVIEDVEADAPYAPLRSVARAAGYRGVQSTPLIGRDGAPLGMLSTHFRSVHRPGVPRRVTMSRSLSAFIVLLFFGSMSAQDRDGVEGTWRLESIEESGKPVPAGKDIRIKVSGSKLFILGVEIPVKVNKSEKPTEVDFFSDENKVLGIYEVQEDTLRVCVGGDKRPTEFTTKFGSGTRLFVFRREKKAK